MARQTGPVGGFFRMTLSRVANVYENRRNNNKRSATTTGRPGPGWRTFVPRDGRRGPPLNSPFPAIVYLDRQPRQPESGDQDEPDDGGRSSHDANAVAGHADYVLRGRAGHRGHVRPVEPNRRPGRSYCRPRAVHEIQQRPGTSSVPVGQFGERRYVCCSVGTGRLGRASRRVRVRLESPAYSIPSCGRGADGFCFPPGFSNATKTWLPVNPQYWRDNMEELSKSKSQLRTYRQLSRLRKIPTIIKGDLHLYKLSQWVLGFSRYARSCRDFVVPLRVMFG